MRLEIQAVDGHFVLLVQPSTLPAATARRRDSVSSSRVGRRFFSEEGAEGGDTNSPPVGDAAGEGDVGGFGGADPFHQKGTKCSITSR